jgi:hypothetical protein
MITFIIPTIGRNTLTRTVISLLQQTNKNWKAIIVFDGVPIINFNDSRITAVSIPKKGKLNHAGEVRNFAMKMVTTEWVGFVDDDDAISKDYVEKFEEEIKITPEAKCIIFRMKFKFGGAEVMPEPHHDNFYQNKVGISFAFKKDLNLSFDPSSTEDFYLLSKIRNQKNKIIISPYVTYFVRESPSKMPEFKRVEIN